MTEIPTVFYTMVGVLIVANIGAIGSLIVFIFKCGKFVQATENGIEKAQATAVRAHKGLEKHEERFHAP